MILDTYVSTLPIRFDVGGPGSCLKRYSDPTFFRRVSGSTTDATADKIQRENKARKKVPFRELRFNKWISTYLYSLYSCTAQMVVF